MIIGSALKGNSSSRLTLNCGRNEEAEYNKKKKTKKKIKGDDIKNSGTKKFR